ncbi:MAG: hypothetical protein Fur0022_38600 [Anaerolineales bacterium]
MSSSPIQYAAYIEHVKEVTLYDFADLAFWREVLKGRIFIPMILVEKWEF